MEQGRIIEVVKLAKKMDNLRVRIQREYGVKSNALSVENEWKLAVASVKFPSWSLEIPPFLEKQIFLKRNYLAFIRNATADAMRVASLGELYDRLFQQILHHTTPEEGMNR